MAIDARPEKVYVYSAPTTERGLKLLKIGREYGPVLLLIMLALGLRLFNLAHNPIWFDESFDVYISQELSFSETLTYFYPYNLHPPLIYPILHLWQKVMGLSEAGVRSFSVVSAIGTLLLVYLTVRRSLKSQKLALTGLLLVAISPLHIYWSQSIRPYAWFGLLVAFSMYCLLLVNEKPLQNWRWALYCLSVILMLYATYLSFHAIAAQLIFLAIVLFKNWKALARGVVTFLVAGIAYLPWLGHFFEHSKNTGNSYLADNRSLTRLIDALNYFSSWDIPISYLSLTGAVFLPLYLLGLVWLWQNKRVMALFWGCWSVVPLITAWLSSQINPNFEPRFFVFCIPAFLVTVGVGAWSLQNNFQLAPNIALVLILGLNLVSYVNYNSSYKNQDWRGLVDDLIVNHKDGDLVLMGNPDGYIITAFDYYYVYQRGAPGNLERDALPRNFFRDRNKPVEAKSWKQRVEEKFQNRDRVWLVRFYDGNTKLMEDQILKNIPENFHPAFYKEYYSTEQGTISLTLYAK
jgi:uncharacterized membrane protein